MIWMDCCRFNTALHVCEAPRKQHRCNRVWPFEQEQEEDWDRCCANEPKTAYRKECPKKETHATLAASLGFFMKR